MGLFNQMCPVNIKHKWQSQMFLLACQHHEHLPVQLRIPQIAAPTNGAVRLLVLKLFTEWLKNANSSHQVRKLVTFQLYVVT